MTRTRPFVVLSAAALLGLALAAGPTRADMREHPPSPPPPADDTKKPPTTGDQKKSEEARFLHGYKLAYDLIKTERYADGIAAMRALGQDGHPDVATSVGFAWRKLGDYQQSKAWYDRALMADPKHVTALSYYGMWHAEQGQFLKAIDFLERIGLICGSEDCAPYQNLKGAIADQSSY